MKGSPHDLLGAYRSGQTPFTLVSHIIIVGMMISVALAFHFLGNRFIPGWKGGYLVWMAIFLSIEAMYSRKRVKDLDTRERLIFRLSEWVAFLAGIKIAIYLTHNPAQLLTDLPLWQEDFFQNFFTGEYMLAIFIAVLVWWSSLAFSSEIEELYSREMDAEWDDPGKLQNALRDIRVRILSKIFFLGALLVALAVAAHLEVPFEAIQQMAQANVGPLPVANVLLYFVLALVLITQTQFALLQARWINQRLPISAQLTRNWIRYGLFFFLLCAVIVFFLPTNYSIGLLDTLRLAVGYLLKALAFLLVVISLPVTWCMSLFSFTNQVNDTIPPGELGSMPAVSPHTPLPWWEFVQSLLFWAFFLGIIIFSVRFYLMQNAALLKTLKGFAVFLWVNEVWKRVKAWLRGANRHVSAFLAVGIKRLRVQRVRLPASPLKRVVNFSKMSAREKIIYYYVSLIQLGENKGLVRKPSQTPSNYQKSLSNMIPEVDQDLQGLTETFLEARYSLHAIEDTNAVLAGSLWEKIKAILRSWRKQEPDQKN